MNIEITPEFNRIFNQFDAGQNVAVFGSGGTGKTVLIRQLRMRGQAMGKNITVLAPTGISARNVDGKTINSGFGLPTYLSSSHTLSNIHPAIAQSLIQTDILIIDEMSMVNSLNLDNISDIAKYARCNQKPFGGMQVVIVGDPFQLSPVLSADGERKLLLETCGYQSIFFFASNVYNELNFKHFELTHVFRQADKDFVNVLNRVRLYLTTKQDIDYLNQCVQNNAPQNTLILGTTRKVVDRHNTLSLDSNRNEAKFYDATVTGNIKPTDCPTEFQLFLKEGCRVMIVANIKDDSDVEAVNGDMGTIEALYDDLIYVALDNGNLIAVERFSWQKYGHTINNDGKTWENYLTGVCVQFPVKVAAASTVHKAQGLSLDRVHFDLSSRPFSPGQTYTALSRARSFEGLSLSRPLRYNDLMQFAPRLSNGRPNESKILIDWYQQIYFI